MKPKQTFTVSSISPGSDNWWRSLKMGISRKITGLPERMNVGKRATLNSWRNWPFKTSCLASIGIKCSKALTPLLLADSLDEIAAVRVMWVHNRKQRNDPVSLAKWLSIVSSGKHSRHGQSSSNIAITKLTPPMKAAPSLAGPVTAFIKTGRNSTSVRVCCSEVDSVSK